ncbi:MAG: hypothetical protein ACLFTK_02205 [Anaerolineales bacterium]
MPQKIAVMVVHGIGTQSPDFAEPVAGYLKSAFTLQLSYQVDDPAAQVVVRPAYWAPVLDGLQHKLWQRMQTSPNPLDFSGLRKFGLNSVADAIAYQPTTGYRHLYDQIHHVLMNTLRELAELAGPRAPLCVIAHSLGTVIASNYFYDLRQYQNKVSLESQIMTKLGDSALEKGHTFAFFYTLGSPIPLWSLPYDDFGQALTFPPPELADLHPALTPEWVNLYDRDDVIGFPLRPLNATYARSVTQDREVNVGNIFERELPLSHLVYWQADAVRRPIAAQLVAAWRAVNT